MGLQVVKENLLIHKETVMKVTGFKTKQREQVGTNALLEGTTKAVGRKMSLTGMEFKIGATVIYTKDNLRMVSKKEMDIINGQITQHMMADGMRERYLVRELINITMAEYMKENGKAAKISQL